jgi:hypothetical protein
MNITIEKPRLCLPASLLVDDPAPCINPFYYYRLQVDREGHERHEPRIPLDFLRQFADVCRARGLRGKFSVLPYPAGLGSILDGWEGCDRAELAAWLELARAEIAPRFDITPEVLTHTRALNLDTGALRDESEQGWMATCSPDELRRYLVAALEILREAGFAPAGVTQPVAFAGSRELYARATLEAVRAVGGPPVTYFFIDGNFDPPPLPPFAVALLHRERGEAVVDIVANCNDYFWPTQRVTSRRAEQVVDELITADGRSGRLAELAAAGEWLLPVCHWQTLFSDGSREGLRALDEAAARLERTHGDRLRWLTPGEIARYRAAGEACAIEAIPHAGGWTIALDAPIACPDFTLSLALDAAAPQIAGAALRTADRVTPLGQDAAADGLLAPGSWRQQATRVSLCFDLQRGRQVVELSADLSVS